MKTIRLNEPGTYDLTIEVSDDDISAITKTDLSEMGAGLDDPYNAAMHGIEALVLAQACAGINLETEEYRTALTTAVEAINNQLGD